MKLEELKRIIASLKSVAVAYSGGVDSTLLLKVAKDVLGDKAVAVTATSPIYPSHEITDAKKMTERLGVRHFLLPEFCIKTVIFKHSAKNFLHLRLTTILPGNWASPYFGIGS